MEREAGVGNAGDGPGAVGGHVVQAEQRLAGRAGGVEGGAGEDDRLVSGNHSGAFIVTAMKLSQFLQFGNFCFNYRKLNGVREVW